MRSHTLFLRHAHGRRTRRCRRCSASCAIPPTNPINWVWRSMPYAASTTTWLWERYDHPEPRLADLDQPATDRRRLSQPRGLSCRAGARNPPPEHAGSCRGEQRHRNRIVWCSARLTRLKAGSGTPYFSSGRWMDASRSHAPPKAPMNSRRNDASCTWRSRARGTIWRWCIRSTSIRRAAASITPSDQLSRFLDRGVRKCLERVVLSDESTPDAAAPPSAQPEMDLQALLRGRFGGSGSA